MKIQDIHVGDVVIFRDWEDMKAEFGLSEVGDIDCKFGFTDEMILFCGRECIVTDINIEHEYLFLEDPNCPNEEPFLWYTISADMVKPAPQIELPPEEDFISILICGRGGGAP